MEISLNCLMNKFPPMLVPFFKCMRNLPRRESPSRLLINQWRSGDAPRIKCHETELHCRRHQSASIKGASNSKFARFRYLLIVPATRLADLPSPLKPLAQDCVHDFLIADRGAVRRNNDRPSESRATFFASWCKRMGYTKHDLQGLNHNSILFLLGFSFAR